MAFITINKPPFGRICLELIPSTVHKQIQELVIKGIKEPLDNQT